MKEKDFKRLVDPSKPRSLRLRQILKYIYENPGDSQLRIAEAVYGKENALNSYKSLRSHLKRLESLGLIKIENGKEYKVFLTPLGKELCEKEEITVLSKSAKEFVRVLNNWILTTPLTPEEESQLASMLDDKLLEVLFAISETLTPVGNPPPQLPEDLKKKYFALNPKIDVWRCLRGLWIYLCVPHAPLVRKTFFGIETEPTKPLPHLLVEASGLKQRIDRMAAFFNRLLLKNPMLADLKELVTDPWRYRV